MVCLGHAAGGEIRQLTRLVHSQPDWTVSAATAARQDATVPVIIFSIGLGGAADAFPGAFLEHVSNTTTSDLHSSHLTEPSGQYIYVTGKGQLAGAFEQIASFVLRLTS